MPTWIRRNSLSVAMFGAFAVFVVLQSVFGWQVTAPHAQTGE